MSLTSDLRSYADTALDQGKQVLGQAQTQLDGVSGQANAIVGKWTSTALGNVSELTEKANGTVTELVETAEKAINLDAIKAVVEPYLTQALGYATGVTDRAGQILTTVKSDKRVAQFVDTAESVSGLVVATVQERVVKPVVALRGGSAPAPVATPAAAPAAKAPAKKAPAKTAPAARKAPAKKATTTSKAAPAKASTVKATPAKPATEV